MTNPVTLNPASVNPATPLPGEGIRWPERFQPNEHTAAAPVHVRNEMVIAAPAARVWAELLLAENWPTFYPSAKRVHFLSHAGPSLRDRSRFRWKTFGVTVTCKVLEFEPCSRLAWEASGIGLDAWHAWLLTPLPDGRTHVLTEETQHGWLARVNATLLPRRMRTEHQLWLEGLARAAQG